MRILLLKVLLIFMKKLFIIMLVIIVFCVGVIVYKRVERKYFYPIKHIDIVAQNCREYELEMALVFSVINVESSFDERAVSGKGAKGLMQIMDSTAEFIAEKLNVYAWDIFDAEVNIKFGCYYLRYLLDRFNNEKTAIIAYNAGEGNVRKWLSEKKYSKDGENLQHIPFDETRDYIEKIYKNRTKYYKIYPEIVDK